MHSKLLTAMRMAIVLIAGSLAAASIGCGSGSSAPPPNPAPSLTAISPNGTAARVVAFTLNVHGSNFVPASIVEWGGSSRPTAFVSSSQLQAHIMTADLAAVGKVMVTVVNPAPGGGSSNGVIFTIAADTIAFESTRSLSGADAANTNATSNVWAMNPDGSNQLPLTKLTTADSFGPAWSRDGSKIAFFSPRALNGSDAANLPNITRNIWLMNGDGSGATPLTKLTAAQAYSLIPVWSPDGSKVAFISARALDGTDAANTNGAVNIWVANADGTGATPLTMLTAAGAKSFDPAWSPDGTKIAYDSARALNGSNAANAFDALNIWVANADGTGTTPLTKLAGGAFSALPVWSPDGTKIAFQSTRALDGSDGINPNFTFNVWAMKADGSGATPLTKVTASAASSDFPE